MTTAEASPTNDELTARAVSHALTELHSTAQVAGEAAFTAVAEPPADEIAKPYVKSLVQLGKQLDVKPRGLPTTLGPFGTNYITFNNGVPVGGFGSLTLHSDGTCQFSGHFHDSGFTSYNVSLSWVIVDAGGTAYTFEAHGRTHGTGESGSRDFNWNQTVHNAAVAQNWGKLCAHWSYRWTARANWDIAAAINDIVSALKTAGTVITTVIAVIG